jgi:hypothetical protein
MPTNAEIIPLIGPKIAATGEAKKPRPGRKPKRPAAQKPEPPKGGGASRRTPARPAPKVRGAAAGAPGKPARRTPGKKRPGPGGASRKHPRSRR